MSLIISCTIQLNEERRTLISYRNLSPAPTIPPSPAIDFIFLKAPLLQLFVCNHNIFYWHWFTQFSDLTNLSRLSSFRGWKSACFRLQNLILVLHENQSCIFKEFKISIRERLCLWKLNLCYFVFSFGKVLFRWSSRAPFPLDFAIVARSI